MSSGDHPTPKNLQLRNAGKGIDHPCCHASMYDLPTALTSREFIRHFARLKKAAANGEEVVVRDRQGRSFVFQAKDGGPSAGGATRSLRRSLRTFEHFENR